MFELSELFEGLWPEPAAIDFAAWSMVGVFAAVLWLALKMLKRGHILVNPLLLLSLVSLGLPGIIQIFLQDKSDSNSGQLLRFLDLFPELTTNILILASAAELLIGRLDLPRYIGLSLRGIIFCLISCVLSTPPHLTWEQLSDSTTITLWADGLVVGILVLIEIGIGSRTGRKANSNQRLFTGAIAGTYIAANLINLLPAAKFSVAQIENTIVGGSLVGLLTVGIVGLFIEPNASERAFEIQGTYD